MSIPRYNQVCLMLQLKNMLILLMSVELKNLKIDGKYKGKVNKPKKHDNYRLHNLIIQKGSITWECPKYSPQY